MQKVILKKKGIYSRYYIDGERKKLAEIAEMLGITRTTLSESLGARREEDKSEWLETRLWLKSIGVNGQTRVYKNGMCWITAQMIVTATGVSMSAARARGYRFERGLSSYEQMMAPASARKKVVKNNVSYGDLGLGPRKSIEEIKPAGSYESEHFNPQKFYANRGGQQTATVYLPAAQ